MVKNPATALLALLPLLVLFSCKKDDTERAPIDFAVTNTWECELGGKTYSGTIDTSFLSIYAYNNSRDTTILCTGTSFDKKAHINFSIQLSWSSDRTYSTAASTAHLIFDTASRTYFKSYQSPLTDVVFTVDSTSSSKVKGRFSGKVAVSGTMGPAMHDIRNGKFSFEFNKGTAEPRFFSYSAGGHYNGGHIKSARHESNTLIMDGFNFWGDTTFQLIVRTGSVIRPGVYESRKLQAGLQVFRPSIYPYFVDDTLGDLEVEITSVQGDVVEGRFSGQSRESFAYAELPITNGLFRCRVKDYRPAEDSANKWWFRDEHYSTGYSLYGGNMLRAVRSQVGNKHYLALKGESDHGASALTLVLSGYSPISPGVYDLWDSIHSLDTLSFRSPWVTINRQVSGTACVIDSIDNGKVVGRFYDTDDAGYPYNLQGIKKGYFRANF